MNRYKKIKSRNLFKDEDGFTTLSVVISLLVTLSLLFSTAQIYRLSSASADIQNVADSSSLAAENQVAEFMILVRVSDSVILSLGLAGIVCTGLGVVALCTPVTAGAADILLDSAEKFFNARDSFAEKSSKALNEMQKALPFLSSVKAYQVAKSNNGGTFNSEYVAISLLMPGTGIEITPGNIESAKEELHEVKNQSDEIKKAASEAEEAAKAANEAKLKAFMADCGNNPNYCMYERAKTKAYMNGVDNPLYTSADTWSFSVPLKRSQAYYPKRIQIEKPDGSSVESKANSALRKVFYTYAEKELSQAYVHDDGESFNAYFPHLPKNTEEMKQTSMYTNVMFPISDSNCMHAYKECPGCINLTGYGSISQMEAENYSECPYCKFRASSLGRVASASSAIDNGYEYHYAIVEKAAQDYQKCKNDAAPLNKKVKDFALNIFSKVKDLIKEIFNKRIYAKPPGAYGNITLVVNTNSSPASKGFESSFVSDGSTLGVRAAISSSTLIEEYSDEGKTIINSLLDGLVKDMPAIAGAGGIALNCWSGLLSFYSNGEKTLLSALEKSLNQLPLISQSGLGTWAAGAISSCLEDIGLEAPSLNALKPVLINSYYIANKECKNEDVSDSFSKNFAIKYLTIQDKAISFSDSTSSLLSGISNGKEFAKLLNIDDIIYSGGTIEIAVIQPLGSMGPSIPIKIKLPKFATGTMQNIVSWLATTLQAVSSSIWGGKVWR